MTSAKKTLRLPIVDDNCDGAGTLGLLVEALDNEAVYIMKHAALAEVNQHRIEWGLSHFAIAGAKHSQRELREVLRSTCHLNSSRPICVLHIVVIG